MRHAPRFFPRALSRRARRVYGAVLAWFLFVVVATTWPAYGLLARVRPFVLGMPLSLAWPSLLLVASFGVGYALYRWELRNGLIGADEDHR